MRWVSIPDWAVASVAALYEAGIVTGDSFQPNAAMTRGEIAAWIVSAMK